MTTSMPIAKWHGTLKIGEQEYDCYVLNTGERVMSQRGAMIALTGTDYPAREFLGSKALNGLLPKDFLPRGSRRFLIPQNNTEAIGFDAAGFVEICRALVSALASGKLVGEAQQRAGVIASIVLGACATVGITALVDEATGYQHERPSDGLQVLLAAYISDAEREWAKTFPDALWVEFRRLAGSKYRTSKNPREFGKLVKRQVYGTLEPDVLRWLEQNKPNPSKGHNWHQSLTEFGTRNLREHIFEIIGIAKACYSLREFKERVAEAFSKKPVQKRLPIPVRRAA